MSVDPNPRVLPFHPALTSGAPDHATQPKKLLPEPRLSRPPHVHVSSASRTPKSAPAAPGYVHGCDKAGASAVVSLASARSRSVPTKARRRGPVFVAVAPGG
jgi:hypothetical protein